MPARCSAGTVLPVQWPRVAKQAGRPCRTWVNRDVSRTRPPAHFFGPAGCTGHLPTLKQWRFPRKSVRRSAATQTHSTGGHSTRRDSTRPDSTRSMRVSVRFASLADAPDSDSSCTHQCASSSRLRYLRAKLQARRPSIALCISASLFLSLDQGLPGKSAATG